ncbi:MAG: SAF domain-containing protein [Psychrobacillus psychrodurans]
MKAGEKFNPDNIKIVRPGYGLEPKYYEKVLDATAKKEYKAGTSLTLDDLFNR